MAHLRSLSSSSPSPNQFPSPPTPSPSEIPSPPSRSIEILRSPSLPAPNLSNTLAYTIYSTPLSSPLDSIRGDRSARSSFAASSIYSFATARSSLSTKSESTVIFPSSRGPGERSASPSSPHRRRSRVRSSSFTSNSTIRPFHLSNTSSIPPNITFAPPSPSPPCAADQPTTHVSLPSSTCLGPDEGPRFFSASAKTGSGVAEVFEYVARRVVQQWEWEASMGGRRSGLWGPEDPFGDDAGLDTLRLHGQRRPIPTRSGCGC